MSWLARITVGVGCLACICVPVFYDLVNKNTVFSIRKCVLLGVIVLCAIIVGYTDNAHAAIASRDYVEQVSETKESLSNKTDTIDETSTTAQYPSAKSVYDGLSYRVDIRNGTEQTLAGKYTVSGEFIVPDQPLPALKAIPETE